MCTVPKQLVLNSNLKEYTGHAFKDAYPDQ